MTGPRQPGPGQVIPELITLVRHGRDGSLMVDGKPFPYPVGQRMEVTVDPGAPPNLLPSVRLDLMARRVEVVNRVRRPDDDRDEQDPIAFASQPFIEQPVEHDEAWRPPRYLELLASSSTDQETSTE